MSENNSQSGEKSEAIPPFSTKRVRFDRVEVRDAGERGLGVFATAPIKARRSVGRVFGDVKPKGYVSPYCVEFGDGALEPYPPYRFLNHSCDPNCEFVEWTISDQASTAEGDESVVLELWVHALRDIASGEELTIDYGWDWRSAIPCKCGSPRCRGWVCREDELDLCRERFRSESAER